MASSDAVLLIAFGGPTRADEIRPFLENVTRGRRIPPERLDEVAHHYELIGGCSPLNELTFRQAEALRRVVGSVPVYVGMRNWEPYIADTLARMALDGVRRATGVILSPHAAESSRERYMEAVDAGLVGRNSCAADRRNDQPRENGDDHHDDHHFDESEAATRH